MKSYDVIIIGAGHNGMAASIKLAKTGRKVLVLESSSEFGGMASSNILLNDNVNQPLPHLINHLCSKSIKDLDLIKYGLKTKKFFIPSISVDKNQNYISFSSSYGSQIDGMDSNEKANWEKLKKRMFFQANLLKKFLYKSPINRENNSLFDKLDFLKTGINLRIKGREEFQEFFRMMLMCVADILEEEINNDLLKGLLAFDATLGINLGPRSPTSYMGLLYRLAGEFNGAQGAQIFPEGGIPKLIETFYKSSTTAGVEFIFKNEAKNLIFENNKVTGIKTQNGEEFFADIVLSSVSPIKTFFDFIGSQRLDTGLLREIKSLRYKGNVSKLNLLLNKIPKSSFLSNEQLSARITYTPSINHVEKNFNPSKYQQLPEDPNFELLFPSIIDETNINNNGIIASIIIQNTPYSLKDGWDSSKKLLYSKIMLTLETIFPDIKKSVLASKLISPLDIETIFNVPGGHWHHSELQIDRMYSLRPVFKYSSYRTPIHGLYICGAGTHPGGGISGKSGINAANQIIKDQKQNNH